jgi:hypothetical protein
MQYWRRKGCDNKGEVYDDGFECRPKLRWSLARGWLVVAKAILCRVLVTEGWKTYLSTGGSCIAGPGAWKAPYHGYAGGIPARIASHIVGVI